MCKAVHVVTTCADSTQKSVHLAVIQALLTIATSEHLVPHGETLVQCLKVVFNLAIATEDELVTLTAQNALLQVRSLLIVPYSDLRLCLVHSVQEFADRNAELVQDRGIPVRC